MNQTAHELYHHGVIGMKWGVRRYQPYGVGYDPEHRGKNVGEAAREAKAGKDPARHTRAAGQMMVDIAKKRKQRAEERADDKEFRKAEKAKDKEFKRSERAKDAEAKRKVKEIEAERRRQEWMKEQLKKDQFKQQEREKARDDKRHDKEVANKAKRDRDNLKDQLRNQKKMQEVRDKETRDERKAAERETKKEARQQEREAEKAAKKEEKKQIALEKKMSRKAAVADNDPKSKGVDISKMSTDELNAYTKRMQAENNYQRELQNKKQMQKQQAEAGKSFAQKLAKDVGTSLLNAGKQVAIDAGKKYIDKLVYEYTTPETKKAIDKMVKETENLNKKNNYYTALYNYQNNTSDYRKQQEAERPQANYYSQRNTMYSNMQNSIRNENQYKDIKFEQDRYEEWLKKHAKK